MDYLSQEEQETLCILRRTDSFVEETLRQLDRILTSLVFRRVHETTKAFLGFVVSIKLLGKIEEIKEMMIAIRVWKEGDFDPLETSKIRMAAGSLREKLVEYYRTAGQRDPIEISLPNWGYVPDVRDRRLTIDVALFENLNPNGDQQHLCHAASDEIVHRLTDAGAVLAQRVETLASIGSRLQFGLKGCLHCRQNDMVKMNVWLQDLSAGRTIWDTSSEGHRDDLLKLSRQVADAVLKVLRPEIANAPASNRDVVRRPPHRSTSREGERLPPKADIA